MHAVVLALCTTACTPLSDPAPDFPSLGIAADSTPATPGTYAGAVREGVPHLCEVAVRFWGTRTIFQAYVEGENFDAVGSKIDARFVRLNGIGYSWDEGAEPLVINKIRLNAYREAYEHLMQHPLPRLDNSFVFVEPAPYEPCVRAPSRSIIVPEGDQRDVTDALVAAHHEYFEKAVSTLESLPFAILLPDPSLSRRFPYTRGGASKSSYGLEYLAHALHPEGESSQLNIGFSAHSPESPAFWCGRSRPPRYKKCVLLFTTDRGYEVFQRLEIAHGSSPVTRLPHYYAKVGDVLLHLSYPHWSRGTSGALEFSAHNFADGELAAIFDSLREARPEDLVRFRGMTVRPDP
jgi:hypothetical protein